MQKPIKTTVAIIGAGPAGISTAIQLRRYKIPFLLFEKGEPGGLLKNASLIENYPAFPEGIDSRDLIGLFKKHLHRYSIEITGEEVVHLTRGWAEGKGGEEGFLLLTSSSLYFSKFAVVATGTKPKEHPLFKGLAERLKERVLYEIHSIREVEGQALGILGAGDGAFDYALNLSKKNQIYLLNRSSRIKALPLLVDQVKIQPHIARFENTLLKKIEPGHHKALSLSLQREGRALSLEVDYLVGALGRDSQKDFYSELLWKREKDLREQGLLYLPGDIENGLFRQVSISVGGGIKTAMEIWEQVKEGKK